MQMMPDDFFRLFPGTKGKRYGGKLPSAKKHRVLQGMYSCARPWTLRCNEIAGYFAIHVAPPLPKEGAPFVPDDLQPLVAELTKIRADTRRFIENLRRGFWREAGRAAYGLYTHHYYSLHNNQITGIYRKIVARLEPRIKEEEEQCE